MNRKSIIYLFMMISFMSGAQNNSVEMADSMRENGKINVVIGVLLIIFAAITVFLVLLERRLKKAEDQLKNK